MSEQLKLESLREEVQDITIDIIKLTGKRFKLTKKIDRIKRSLNLPIVDYKVEKNLKSSIVDACKKYNVNEIFGLRILNLLIKEAVRMQKSKDKVMKAISIIDMFILAKKMERKGYSVIHLEVGEPDFGPPERVKKTTCDSIKEGFTHYTEPSGIPDLREAIVNFVNERYKRKISPEQVAVTCGGRFSVYASILTKLTSGDEAIVIQPAWPAYVDCIEAVGGRAICFKTKLRDGWRPDIESLSELVNDSTKLIVINYPNNPTGKVLEKHDLKAIVELANERKITILSDEVYLDYAFEPYNSILEFHNSKSIYVSSFSKSYGMTGFRIGYAISDIETIKKISGIQALAATSVPEFIQYAAIKALKCRDDVKEYINLIKKRIKLICEELKKINVKYYEPKGAFYIFPQISQNENFDIISFSFDLLKKKNVCVAPGTTFGDYPNYIRISACQKEHKILEGLMRIGDLLYEGSGI